MAASVIPFPLARRRRLIRRQAAFFAGQSRRSAEGNLAHQLEIQRRTLLAKGVAAEQVEPEVRALELAIRAEAARLILGGVA